MTKRKSAAEYRDDAWRRMYNFICAQQSERKQQLAFCACCRCTWPHVRLDRNREAIEASERYADGLIGLDELKLYWNRVRFEPVVYQTWFHGAAGPLASETLGRQMSPHSDEENRALEEFRRGLPRRLSAWHVAWTACGLDVFGHPLNDARFSPEWRTDTAIALARTMYDSRESSAMPILADALQDAGCDNEDILNHCRDANAAHVRGCWVVDLLLGKE